MGHKTEYVTEGNDRFYQCSCGKQISTGHEADKHLLQAENQRLRDENDNLRHLLTIYLPPHSGYCATVECDCGPLRREADRLLSVGR